jgi:DNA adenine methylase
MTKRSGGLPPLIKYPGGKGRLASLIVRHLPDHDTYIEPFAGGAAVFLRKPLAEKKSVISDKDSWGIEFFDGVRRGQLKKCRGGLRGSRSLFDRAKRAKKDPCMKLALSTLSYHGDRDTYGASKSEGQVLGRSKLKNLSAYEKKLRKAHLAIADFAKTMRKHDRATAVHFLDPPWPLESGYSDSKYELGRKGTMGKAYDPEHVVDVSAKMKGGVFIIYGNHPSVRKAFRRAKKLGFKIYAQPVSTNRGNGGMEKRINLIAIKKPDGPPTSTRRARSTKKRKQR